MPKGYDIWLTSEIEGAQLDLETKTMPTKEEEALLRALSLEEKRGHTFHRLVNGWSGYKAGSLVLYDGQEVLLFLREPE